MQTYKKRIQLLRDIQKAGNSKPVDYTQKEILKLDNKKELKIGPTVDFLYNNSKNRFLEIGKNVNELLGITDKEVLELSAFELLAEIIDLSHLDAVVSLAKRSIELCKKNHSKNITVNIDFNINTRNNLPKRLLVQYCPIICDDNGLAIITKGKYIDITHLKQGGGPAICIVMDDEIFMQSVASSEMISKFNNSKLTQKELEVIKQLSLGYQSKEIASFMNISKHTVYTHIKNIKNKTGKEITQIIISLKAKGLI